MSQMQFSPSDDELNHAPVPPPPSAGPRTTSPPDTASEPHVSSRGRRSAQATPRTPRRRGLPSPPPARTPASSPASSYRSAVPTIPPIGKWTVLSLRQALINSDIQPSRRMTKAQLYNLYVTLQSSNLSPKSTPGSKAASRPGKSREAPNSPRPTPPPSRARFGLPHASPRGARISASLGRAPDSTATRPHSPPALAELFSTALPAAVPYTAGPAGSPSASQCFPPAVSNSFPLQWPPAPIADASVRLPPLAVQAQTFHHLPATTANPSHFQWPAAQATPQADLSVRLPPPIVAAQASLPYSSLLNAKSQYSLFTATPMPVPPNAVALEPPPVTQNIRAQILAAHHPDSDFTEYLLSGLQHGFKPGVVCPLSQNIICDNLQSALAEPNVVDNLIKKEVESGFMIGPFDEPPFKVFRISPIGVATRKFSGKKRLIVDLSAPHKSLFPSINSLIPLDEFSLKYHDVDHAVDLIKIVGRGAWLAKIDITSAFKVMPIHPDSWHLFGVPWHGKFYFAVRLTFGCKSSPKIFDMLSEAICWILSNNYAIPHLIHLLDDFLIISPPGAIPAAQILTVQRVFAELGIPIAQEKTMGPATSIEFLGIKLDSVKYQASLPKEKIDRIILISSTLVDSSKCSKRELLSMLGHLNFAMRIIPQGRPFISHLLSLASSVHALEDLISLTPACHDELRLWITFLKQWNGLSFFYKDLISSPIDIQLFTDAAPSVGFGGFCQGRWFASTWPPQIQDTLQSSALFELYPLVVAAFLWGKEWTASSIVVHCDNEATVQCINKGRSHSPALMPLLRRLIWISACDQFILIAKHIPGSKNQIADSLSRFMFQKFRMLAPEADKLPTPVPHYSELIFP
ncbi:uncharacterized protein LOC130083381 [Rhinichthys klamathensis goyatoka]|uniref:uncharacterized protein LOC130083381 n=1 Tax=Rhinichthys klamathensis goyatoka TaxID=3034132 RepID=UPI0024B5C941|nr:uncharacterized protein LOC130083381 [Rhinichthys klamathensis goyatoka]